jgi:hypothetical protein
VGDTARVASPPWNATRGEHVVTARVDPGHVVPELSDANNTLARNLTVPTVAGLDASLLPDPAVVRLRWNPAEPRDGEDVVFTADVRNLANGTAGEFRVAFLLDGQEFDAQRVPGIGSDPVLVLSKPWHASAGPHTAGARLELQDEGLEREQGNDVAFAVVDVRSTALFATLGTASPVDLMLPLAAGALLMFVAVRIVARRRAPSTQEPKP